MCIRDSYKDALSNMKTLVSNLEDKVNVDKLSRTNKQHREKSIEETKEYISTCLLYTSL